MANLQFTKATRKKSRLRLGFVGVSGSGKTFSALQVADGLIDGPRRRADGRARIAVIDSERGSAQLYSDLIEFDVLELDTHSPHTFIAAIQAAEEAGYEVCIIDSLSHAWMGKGGALEMVDAASARSKSGNNFAAWREVTPAHNELVDTMLRSRMHIIGTMRAKTEYVQEKDANGKTVIRKVGLQPVQRDGMEYEFTIVGDIELEGHKLVVTKSRASFVADAVIPQPGQKFGKQLREWLEQGEEVIYASADEVAELKKLALTAEMSYEQREQLDQRIARGLTAEKYAEAVKWVRSKIKPVAEGGEPETQTTEEPVLL